MFEEAQQLYSLQDYSASIELNRKILARDPSFVNALLLLADIYQTTDSTVQEIEQLEKAALLTDMPQVTYRLGKARYHAGHYAQALEDLQMYLEKEKAGEQRAREILRITESCRFALKAMVSPVDFRPRILSEGINSVDDEYWPSLSLDQQKLIFTRLIKKDGAIPQEDFYIAEFDSSGWGRAQSIVEINTLENEGAQSISADGRLLFFTACNRRSGMGSCDIYYSVRQNDQWSAPRNAGADINSRHWEAQPSISSDGRFLYFSSNRPGGSGDKDIWRAELLSVDQQGGMKWKNPVNVGLPVNTPGNETSPFIHPNNKSFYFASDYHTGMGGFDVFMSEIRDDSIFSTPENLGYPINTHHDEQGLFFSADGHLAFFSSERESTGGLDIYSFEVPVNIRPEPVTYVQAKVIDANSRKPVVALIELSDQDSSSGKKRTERTDHKGEILMALPAGSDYIFAVSKKDYLFYTKSFALKESRNIYDPYNLVIELQPVEKGSELNLYNVYFETDSFRILPESEPELQTLLEFLKVNRGIKVEIQGHTDNTGLAASNHLLSEKRAQSVVDYLVEHDIVHDRLVAAGYGQTRPVATNETAEGRQQNRRVTVRVLETGI